MKHHIMTLLFLCLTVSCVTRPTNTSERQSLSYEHLKGTENLYIEFEDIGIFRVDETHRFESPDDRSFIDYVNTAVGKKDLAWIVVGKLAQMHATEAQTISMARQLNRLGFKRVIMQNASSQDQIYIRHDLQH